MSQFKRGDVVQCIATIAAAPSGVSNDTISVRKFYKVDAVPHPHYGMLGVVYDDRFADKVMVWFPSFWANQRGGKIEIVEMPGAVGAFSTHELKKIGTSAVEFPFEKIMLVNQERNASLLQHLNEVLGTNYSTMEEFHNTSRDQNLEEGE